MKSERKKVSEIIVAVTNNLIFVAAAIILKL